MAQGLPVAGEPIVDDDISDTEFKALNPPVQNKKKTLQKRRKLKEARDDERKKFSDKIEKKYFGQHKYFLSPLNKILCPSA